MRGHAVPDAADRGNPPARAAGMDRDVRRSSRPAGEGRRGHGPTGCQLRARPGNPSARGPGHGGCSRAGRGLARKTGRRGPRAGAPAGEAAAAPRPTAHPRLRGPEPSPSIAALHAAAPVRRGRAPAHARGARGRDRDLPPSPERGRREKLPAVRRDGGLDRVRRLGVALLVSRRVRRARARADAAPSRARALPASGPRESRRALKRGTCPMGPFVAATRARAGVHDALRPGAQPCAARVSQHQISLTAPADDPYGRAPHRGDRRA